MKNLEKYKLVNCVFMSLEEYQKLVYEVTNGLLGVMYDYDGIMYEPTEKAMDTNTFYEENILETMSKYFDVQVTSIHTDDSSMLGVWIAYKEKK